MDSGSGNMIAWAYNINDDIWKKIKQDPSVLSNGLSELEMKRINNEIFDRSYN